MARVVLSVLARPYLDQFMKHVIQILLATGILLKMAR